MIKCSSCGNQVSPTDKFCKECGIRLQAEASLPAKAKRSSRDWLILLVLMSVCILCAILATPFFSAPARPSRSASPTPTPILPTATRACAVSPSQVWNSLSGMRTVHLIASKTNGEIRVTVLQLGRIAYDLVIEVKITNIGAGRRHANPGYFRVVDTAGRIYGYHSRTFGLDSPLDAVDLQPGTWTEGQVLFEMSQGSSPNMIIYDDYFTAQVEFSIGEIVGCR